MSHFIHSYPGNKLREMKTVFPLMKDVINDKTIFVEPFCGSQAISYYVSTNLENIQIKYILNDSDAKIKEIFELLTHPERWDNVEKSYNNQIKAIWASQDPKMLFKSVIKQQDLVSYLIYRRYYSKFVGLFPPENRKQTNSTLDLSKVTITNFYKTKNIEMRTGDAIDLIEKYKNNQNAVIVLDPPYIDTCNSDYQYKSSNIYEYIFKNPISEWKCKVFLILEDNWIIRLLFSKCQILSEYNKQYSVSKKKTRHLVITN